MRRAHLLLIAAIVLSVWRAATASAAPDAGAKARGDYGFYGHSAHHSFTSARAHVETYQRYLNETHGIAMPTADRVEPAAAPAGVAARDAVDPEIAREASDAIADDIERIQRHVDRMQARATSLGDDASLAKLADVEKQLGVARRAHAALHEHHAGEVISPAEAMKLADQVNAALRAAHAAHDEVISRLGTTPNP